MTSLAPLTGQFVSNEIRQSLIRLDLPEDQADALAALVEARAVISKKSPNTIAIYGKVKTDEAFECFSFWQDPEGNIKAKLLLLNRDGGFGEKTRYSQGDTVLCRGIDGVANRIKQIWGGKILTREEFSALSKKFRSTAPALQTPPESRCSKDVKIFPQPMEASLQLAMIKKKMSNLVCNSSPSV